MSDDNIIAHIGGPNTKLKRKMRRRLKKLRKNEGWNAFVDEVDKVLAYGDKLE